ncbi:MAG: hypothetical protein Q8N63_04570 [Nanoarchaeota archaeon]|nr:hypothetical protein [Nanoarchaeota archaeon]
MKETQYKYGFGTIREVTGRRIHKKDSIEELSIRESPGRIIVPKLIGVYQEDDSFDNSDFIYGFEGPDIFSELEAIGGIHPRLICVIYDPSIITDDVVKNAITGDAFGRLKYLEHSAELPDFYEKNIPELSILEESFLDPSKENLTVLERAVEYLQLSKRDYGLTRGEAVALRSAKSLLNRVNGVPSLVQNPREIKAKKSFLDLLKENGFDNFLKSLRRLQ